MTCALDQPTIDHVPGRQRSGDEPGAPHDLLLLPQQGHHGRHLTQQQAAIVSQRQQFDPLQGLAELFAGQALAFGAEKFGLSDAFLAGCDGRFVVPMAGFSQSLNVSVAAAVSVYVASGLRRTALKSTTDMTDDEVEALAERWIAADRGDSAT